MMFLPYTFDNARLQNLRTPQGKVAELRIELNNGNKKDKNFSAKKTALKKIVANMTMSNNDMVALFMDIVGCMHIPSLEIKKMYVAIPTQRSAMLTWTGVSCISSTMPG
jgi:vesicle coat complex subunit